MNDLTTIGGAVPAHIAAAFGSSVANSDLAQGVSVGYPIVSYKGKTWHLVTSGERELITQGGEGKHANDPAASLSAVILRANPNLNKVYYPNGYEEGSNEKPLCYSVDSIAPAPDAQEQQSPKCGTCPHNQWGSKISETGGKGKACADSRRLAIAPEGDLENAMLLRVPAASLKTLLAFGQNCERRGVPYQALVTRIGFDPAVAFPSLTFTPERWLDETEVAQVQEMFDSNIVRTITAIDAVSAPDSAGDAAPEVDNFLPPGGPAANAAAPRTAARKGVAKPQEVAQAMAEAQPEPEPEPAPATRSTGFGKAKPAPAAAAAPQQSVSTAAETLVEGAVAELDAVLDAAFDGDED